MERERKKVKCNQRNENLPTKREWTLRKAFTLRGKSLIIVLMINAVMITLSFKPRENKAQS
jgi:hypothetical protein